MSEWYPVRFRDVPFEEICGCFEISSDETRRCWEQLRGKLCRARLVPGPVRGYVCEGPFAAVADPNILADNTAGDVICCHVVEPD